MRFIRSIVIFILENLFCIVNIPEFLIRRKIQYETAKKKVLEQLETDFQGSGFDLVIIELYTIIKEFGWIFFYTSKKHFETKDEDYALAGNAPFIVDNQTGQLTVLGTGDETEFYVSLYRKFRYKPESFEENILKMRICPKCIWKVLFWRIINPIQYKIAEKKWMKMR